MTLCVVIYVSRAFFSEQYTYGTITSTTKRNINHFTLTVIEIFIQAAGVNPARKTSNSLSNCINSAFLQPELIPDRLLQLWQVRCNRTWGKCSNVMTAINLSVDLNRKMSNFIIVVKENNKYALVFRVPILRTSQARIQKYSWARHGTFVCPLSCQEDPIHSCRNQIKNNS